MRAVFAMNEGHHLDEAEKDLRTAMTETDDEPGPALALGAGLLAQGRDADAIAALKVAHKNDVHDINAALMLAIALTKSGKADEAKAELADVLQPHDDPQNWPVQMVKHFQGEMSADDFLKAAAEGPEDTKWTRLGMRTPMTACWPMPTGEIMPPEAISPGRPMTAPGSSILIDTWRRAAEG